MRISWEDSIRALVLILENPWAQKGYEDLEKYFKSNNMDSESEAINFLLREKFNAHDTNLVEEQCEDNKKNA
jgi:hypothetical protein